MKTYWEKLKDPRWQKKRLEILDRDGFSCVNCGDTTKTLNVHHGYYEKGRDPWDYADSTLHTLCEDCHAATTALTGELHYNLAKMDQGFIPRINGYVLGISFLVMPDSCVLFEADSVWGFADAVGLCPMDIEEVLQGRILKRDVALRVIAEKSSISWMRKSCARQLETDATVTT